MSGSSGAGVSAALAALSRCLNCGEVVSWEDDDHSLASFPCGHAFCLTCAKSAVALATASKARNKAIVVRCFACLSEFVANERLVIAPSALLREAARQLAAASSTLSTPVSLPQPVLPFSSVAGGGGAGKEGLECRGDCSSECMHEDRISLWIRRQCHPILKLSVKRTSKFLFIFDAVARKYELDAAGLVFLFEGSRICEDDTPENLGCGGGEENKIDLMFRIE